MSTKKKSWPTSRKSGNVFWEGHEYQEIQGDEIANDDGDEMGMVVPDPPPLRLAAEADVGEADAGLNCDALMKGALDLERIFARHAKPVDLQSDAHGQTAAASTQMRRVHAAAECATVMQLGSFTELMRYVKQQVAAGEVQPLLLLQHRLY